MTDQATINQRAQYAYDAVINGGAVDTRLDTLEARVGPTTDSRAQYAYTHLTEEDGINSQVAELNSQIGIANTAIDDLTARVAALESQ